MLTKPIFCDAKGTGIVNRDNYIFTNDPDGGGDQQQQDKEDQKEDSEENRKKK